VAQPSQPQLTQTLPDGIFNPKEVAILAVRGNYFANWTGVRVEAAVTEAFPRFSFEVTEESPAPSFSAMQFIPGDQVQVFLGGVLAMTGTITERHVGFDQGQHGVKLIGVGKTFDLTNSMPPPEKWGNHDGKSWSQLAEALFGHLNIPLVKVGAVDDTPFKNIQVQPGETIMQTLERYARMRSIVIGSDPNGAVIAMGEHEAVPVSELTEGGNILRANCIFKDDYLAAKYITIGQSTGSDSGSGDPQNKQYAVLPGTSKRNTYWIVPADIADSDHGIKRRADMERLFKEGAYLEADITVQGWFKDYGQSPQLWRAGEYYTVTSQMLLLDGKVLGCKSCVYEQTASGTTTTLSMVDPYHLHGMWNMRVGADEAALAKAKQDAALRDAQAGSGDKKAS
jgi:prophage tail gpP-like protein